MTWFFVAGVANVSIGIILVILVIARRLKNRADYLFLFFSLCVLEWATFHFLWQLAKTPELALLYGRLLMVGPIFMPVFLLHYVTTSYGIFVKSIFLRAGYLVAVVLLIFSPTRYYISHVGPHFSFDLWTMPGPLLHVQSVHFASLIIATWYVLVKAQAKAQGLKRELIRITLLGSILGFGGGFMNYFTFYNIPIKPYGHLSVFLGESLIGYAFLRYKLNDLNYLLRMFLTHLFFIAIFALPISLIISLAKFNTGCSFLIILIFAGVITPLIADRLKASLQRTVDSLPPFRERYSIFRNVGKLIESLEKAPSLREWAAQIIESVQTLYPIRRSSLLIRDEGQNGFLCSAGQGLSPAERCMLYLPFSSTVVAYLEKKLGPLVRDVMEESFEPEKIEEVKRELDYLHGAVVVPIFHENALNSILIVGEKERFEMFNNLELTHLEYLAHAAERRLNSLLSGIKKAQWSASWAHDLTKPFSEKGCLEDLRSLLKGNYGPLDSEVNRVLKRIEEEILFVGKGLHSLVKGNDSTARKNPVIIRDVYFRLQERWGGIANEKEVRLLITAPPENYLIDCDGTHIERRVFGNIVENALRHTQKGGTVEVGYRIEGETFIGYVKDTGPGIKNEDIPRLFTPGTQLDPHNKGLAGLGLASVKSVIDAHGGRVWVESEVGKGSTFYFALPVQESI